MIRVPSFNRTVNQLLYQQLIDFRNIIFIYTVFHFPIVNRFMVSNYQQTRNWSVFVCSRWTGILEKYSFELGIMLYSM